MNVGSYTSFVHIMILPTNVPAACIAYPFMCTECPIVSAELHTDLLYSTPNSCMLPAFVCACTHESSHLFIIVFLLIVCTPHARLAKYHFHVCHANLFIHLQPNSSL